MKKLLRLFMLTVMMLPFALNAQNTLTVADGTTTNSYVPVYGLYVDEYLRCQTIYPAAMIDAAATTTGMMGGAISSLTYYLSSPAAASWDVADFVVKIKEVTATTLSAFVDMTDATTVYTGPLDGTQSTMVITLTTPYTYQGGNLLIEVYSTMTGTYKSCSFYGVSSTGSSWQGHNSSAWTSVSGSAQNFIPKTTFTFTGGSAITCSPVQNLAIDGAQTTSNSLTLTWADAFNTGATYTVYDMADNTVVQSGIYDTTYTVTGLNANTEYTFGVEANCSATDASAVMSVGARTACAAQDLPWTCGFESNEIVSTTQVNALPWCSSRYSAPSTVSNPNYPYSYSPSTASYIHSGSRCLYFYGTTSTSYPDTMAIILPEVNVTTFPMNGNRITFWARSSSTSYDKKVYIYSLNDVADITSATLLDSVLVTGTTHVKYSVPLIAAPATNAYLAIMVKKGSGSLYMDDVTIEEMPACLEVNNLTVTATTANSVSLSWVDAVNASATYTIYNMADSSVVGTATTTTYTIDNLTPYTTYNFGVQANCSAGDAPITTVTVTTDCSNEETMPWSENFDNWSAKSPCWMFLSGLLSEGNPTPNTSAWTLSSSYGSYITLSGKVLAMNLYNQLRYWAVTPIINITSDNAMLSVDVAVSAWSAAEPNYDDNDTLAFLISTDNGTTYTLLQALDYNQLNALGNTYTTIYVPVTGYDGQNVRFAIYGGSISGTSPHDNRIIIDNVTVEAASGCVPVTNLSASNVTAYGATLNWAGTAASYTIYDMADTTVLQTVYDTTVVINTLNPDTPYTLGVQANCGTAQSVIVNVNITTLVTCPAPTNLTATLTPGDGTVATLSWTEIGTATAWQICLDGDTNNFIDATTNPYDFTGLTPEQSHTAQVRAICDVDDQSEWSNLVNFTPTNAYTVTVNDGTTTNSYVPVYGMWVDNITKSQFIIPASSLAAMQFGTINKLTFYASNENISWGAASFNVYLTETNETTVSTLADYASMTQVYAGSVSIVNNIMEVTLTNPYLYMGGNLMVGFLQTVEGTWSSCSWYGVSATGASMGGYGSSISQQSFLPKTTFEYTPGTQPTCLPVTGLTASNITATGATLTWNGNADSYNIYDMSDTTFVANIGDLTYDLTGLYAMTAYTFGVRAVCNGEESPLSITTFNTACSYVTLPYTETFENTSSSRGCWDLVATGNIGGANGMGFVTVNNREVLRFSSYSNATDYNQYGYSPLMDVSSTATNLSVNVVYATYGSGDVLNFGYVTATDTVWFTDDYYTTGNSDWQTLNLVVPATAIQLAIHYYGNYQYYAWIDTVAVSEMTGDYCYAVTNLSVDNATQNSVSLSWTDNNNTGITYTVYNGTTVVASNVASTSYVVTGLTAGTTYTFGVVANCSATDASDMVTITATTECSDITALPYNEGFENGLGCWTTLSGSTDGNPWNAQAAFSSGAIAPHTGSGMAASWSWNNSAMHANAWLISPKFILPNTTEPLTLTWWERANPSYSDRYSVVLSTTTNDTASFTTVVRPYDTTAGEWTIQTVDLSAYAGQSIYIAFHHVDYDKNYLLVDDIALFQGGYVPPAPDTLTVTFAVNNPAMGTTVPAPGTYQYITGDTVHFSATPNAGYSFVGWELTVGSVSDTLGAQYIAAYFPANSMMSYGALTLTALFEAGSTPANDTMIINLSVNDPTLGTVTPAPGTYYLTLGDTLMLAATPNAGVDFNGWAMYVYGQGIGTLPAALNPYPLVVNNNMLSVGELTVVAMFSDSTTIPDSLTIIVNTDDATMGTTNPAPGTYHYAVGSTAALTAVPNTGYSFLYWIETVSAAGLTMSDTIYAQSVSMVVPQMYANMTLSVTAYFQEGQPCATPTGLSVSAFDAESITLEWDANADVNSWNIRYRLQSGDWNMLTSNTNSYTITGLAQNATYVMQVQADCGDGNVSQWSALVTQTTTGLNSYLENSVVLFPNPAREYVDIRIDGDVNVKSMEVYDVYGKLINTVNVMDNPTRINVSGLANGMYFVRVTTEAGVVTKQFVKK